MINVYLRYEGEKIMGFYSALPEIGNFLKISIDQRDLIIKYPQCFKVVNKVLVQIRSHLELERQLLEFNKRRVNISEKVSSVHGILIVDDIEYQAKLEFIQHINLNLNICSFNNKHITKMWCKVDGSWMFKDLGQEDLLKIAIAFDAKRVKLLEDIHNQSD